MPKIDPITGCSVLTTMEFFASEAEREGTGRTAMDLMNDMHDEMALDDEQFAKKLEDPEEALKCFRSGWPHVVDESRDEYDFVLPRWVSEVLCCTQDTGMYASESSFRLTARASREDNGLNDILHMRQWDFGGSRMEPPDWDLDMFWFSDLSKDRHETRTAMHWCKSALRNYMGWLYEFEVDEVIQARVEWSPRNRIVETVSFNGSVTAFKFDRSLPRPGRIPQRVEGMSKTGRITVSTREQAMFRVKPGIGSPQFLIVNGENVYEELLNPIDKRT